MTKRIFLMDIDGTLIDFFPRHFYIFSSFAKDNNLQTTSFRNYKKLRRSGLNDSQILENLNPQKNTNYFTKFKLSMIEDENCLKLDEIFPWTVKTLEYISQKGTIILISVRKKIKPLRSELKRFGIDKYEEILLVEKSASKDLIKKITKIINKYGITKDAIYIGDGKDDAILAKALSVPYIGVLSGISNRKLLHSFYPQRILKSIEQIIKFY